MTPHHLRTRGALLALAAVAVTAIFASIAGALPPGTAPTGTLSMTPAAGNSDTAFQLAFTGSDQFCAGDGAAGYRWSTFITPITNDPATVTFGGSGSAAGPAFTASLRSTDGTILRALQPSTGDGFINLSVAMNFATTQFGVPMPPGDYWIGVACTEGADESIEYWATSITKTATDGAGPNNFTYAPATAPETTTTTTTTTTPTESTSTTIAGVTTSTTAVGGTTSTTAPGGVTTSTVAESGSTSSTVFGSGTPTTLFSSGGSGGGGTFTTAPTRTIANTGSNTGPMLLVAVLLLIGGRAVILAARRTRILPPGER
jgi:hypothetical protein